MAIVLGDGNAVHRGKGHSLSFSKSTKPNDNMEVHPWMSVNDKEDLVAYEVSTTGGEPCAVKVARRVRWGVWGNAHTLVWQRALHLPNQ